MGAKTRCRRYLVALVLVVSTSACKQTPGTFVVVEFTGTIPAAQPIQSISLVLHLGTRTDSTVFKAPGGGAITLPTDATLEITSGSGDLTIEATALADDQSVLATGSTLGRVTVGQTIRPTIDLVLVGDSTDGGASGGSDAQQDMGGSAQDASADTPDPATDVRPGDTAPFFSDTADFGGGKGDVGTGGFVGPGTGGGGGGGSMGGGTGGATGGGTGGATGTFQLTSAVGTLDFGAVPVGVVSAPQTVTITNTGGATTPALNVFVGDGHHFPVYQDRCSGAFLRPGDSCTVVFTFNPDTVGGMQTSGSVGPTQGPVAKFTLSGTASNGAPMLTMSPSTVDFKTVEVGTGSSIAFTVTNNGSADTGTIKIQTTPASAFQITNDTCSATTLGNAGRCTFTLAFAPQTIGIASATITAQSTLGLATTSSAVGVGQDHVQLTVQFAGAGGGSVTGQGLNCISGTACTIGIARIEPTALPRIDLSALANSASLFSGWGAPCSGTGNCTLVMDGPKTITATFDAVPVQITLNVIGLGGQQGTIVSDDGAITCNGSCPALTHAASATFTLVAKPGSSSTFAGWTDGPCHGAGPKCTFALNGPTNITATFGPQSYMFVTSSTVVPGKLGGVAGADDFCQRAASAANLPGAYKAWLTSSGNTARSRLSGGGWIRTDGRPFTKNLAALANQNSPVVYYPPRIDEFGNDLGDNTKGVATGGDPQGPISMVQCDDYTTASGGMYVGNAANGSAGWMMNVLDANGCGLPYRLYCFRTDGLVADIVPPPQPGRRVFVSANPFLSGGAVSPDQQCQADAAAAGLVNAPQFVAFISTAAAPALKRLNASGPPWKRVDDVFVVRQMADFASGRLLAPLGLVADGSLYRSGSVWSGAKDPTAPATATCRDWTTGARTLTTIVGNCDTTETPGWFNDTTTTCDYTSNRLICIEP